MAASTDASSIRAALAQSTTHGNAPVLTALADTVPSVEPLRLEGALPAPASSRPVGDQPEIRFRELGELGQGGLGVVVEALDEDLQRVVAVKRPRDDRLSARTIAALT
ncbi:MAG: hypothetical protein JRI23_28470, partial [Deltaproteobacteria bacterium]|nr:hypothetical protein [Deltaproteobacteria bacterium]MBW2536035.1 hypothetical protein [Deltaproteobacteria bacterium]